MAKRTKSKTDEQVVNDCNALARQFYKSLGYQVAKGYRFDKARHPQEMGMWNMAAIAYEVIEGTDAEGALETVQEDELAPRHSGE